MRVRMLVSIAGLPNPRYGLDRIFSFAPDEIVDLHPDLAAAWIASKHAEEIAEEVVAAPAKRMKKKQDRE